MVVIGISLERKNKECAGVFITVAVCVVHGGIQVTSDGQIFGNTLQRTHIGVAAMIQTWNCSHHNKTQWCAKNGISNTLSTFIHVHTLNHTVYTLSVHLYLWCAIGDICPLNI